VRKNRTPGSVRGASGNWRPYRDGMLVVLQVPEAMKKNRAGEQSHHHRHI
jgi:hypothetical protein